MVLKLTRVNRLKGLQRIFIQKKKKKTNFWDLHIFILMRGELGG
jgi:hypothetical protein